MPKVGVRSASVVNPVATLNRISKRFGATHALRHVSLEVGKGETLALLGENGAGKSTLIKILSGVFQADDGEVILDGEIRQFRSPPEAIAAGVVLIPQELQIAPHLSVADNICLSNLPMHRKFGILPSLNRRQMQETAEAALRRLGGNIDPTQKVSELSFAQRQMVVIARALTNRAKVLVLDEPTAALGTEDTDRLFEVLQALKKDGVASIYITHRLPEIRRIADRAVVLRDGQVVGHFDTHSFDETAATLAMTGREGAIVTRTSSVPSDGGSVLKAPVGGRVQEIARGEVLGVAGLVGSGAAEEVHQLFGLGKVPGWIEEGDQKTEIALPRKAITERVGFVAGERGLSALGNLTVLENIILPYLSQYSSFFRMNTAKMEAVVTKLMTLLDVRPRDPYQKMGSLSGGNQQKVLFARCLLGELRLLLLDDPTAGIDVGAKARIHKLIDEFATSGGSVVISSTDMPELLSLCDRIVAIQQRSAVADFNRNDGLDEAKIRLAMGNN